MIKHLRFEDIDLFSKFIIVFEKIKIKGAMQNLIIEFFSKCVNMADINAFWNLFFKVRWLGPKFNVLWKKNFKVPNFSKCVVAALWGVPWLKMVKYQSVSKGEKVTGPKDATL